MILRNRERLDCQLRRPPAVLRDAVRHRQWILVLLAILAVVCVFISHLPEGPWSAVHGPATALQAVRYALWFFLLIMLVAGSAQLLHVFLTTSLSTHERTDRLEPLLHAVHKPVPIRR
jgi:hypothetical protein